MQYEVWICKLNYLAYCVPVQMQNLTVKFGIITLAFLAHAPQSVTVEILSVFCKSWACNMFSAEALVSIPMKSEIPLNYMIVEVHIFVSNHS